MTSQCWIVLQNEDLLKEIMLKLEPQRGEPKYNPSHLLNMALTCKAFTGPALDSLWRSLKSYTPLVRLLPSRSSTGRECDTPKKWSIFETYSNRIKHIVLQPDPADLQDGVDASFNPLLDILGAPGPVFSKLQMVEIPCSVTGHPFSRFIANLQLFSQLETMHLSLHPAALSSIIQLDGLTALRTLRLTVAHYDRRYPQTESLSNEPLDASLSSATNSSLEPHLPNLINLSVTSDRQTMVEAIGILPLSSFRTIRMSIYECSQPGAIEQNAWGKLFGHLSRCSRETLEVFSLAYAPNELQVDASNCLRGEHLRLMFNATPFIALRRFNLSGVPLSVTDQDISAVLENFPKLSLLALPRHLPSSPYNGVQLWSSLLAVARACPEIQILDMPLGIIGDHLGLPALDPITLPVANSSLQVLHLHLAYTEALRSPHATSKYSNPGVKESRRPFVEPTLSPEQMMKIFEWLLCVFPRMKVFGIEQEGRGLGMTDVFHAFANKLLRKRKRRVSK
ncbi:hypothetical protein D9611_008652 [Ephemerocybe angulata]|uniref:F-box domain-containing protein n=1 Tax=Ephemerocybe angulata TaxID=980116 RepID=A0A8H5AYQ2_9AGAR|nr:hypothetical protein D9611_008652 [Tulosesus angulatus]